jgi:class 3 adenylate cyclase
LGGSQAKKALMAEIMGILEKLGKDKYWLRDEILQSSPGLSIAPVMTSYEMLQKCPTRLLNRLAEDLRKADAKDDMSRFSETFHWFFTDVVASTDPKVTVDDQALKIVELNKLIQKTATFRNRDKAYTIILPTGDGNAIGFKDSPEKPLLLSIELHKAISEYNNSIQNGKKKIEVRIGLSTGPVYHIKDLAGSSNVWGPGLIYARRVMDLGRAKSILATDAFANTVQRLRPDFRKIMHLIGNYPIKKETIPVYNVFGNVDGIDVGTKKNPIVRRVQRSASEIEIRKIVNTFYFMKIEIILEIMEPETMLTHHTWIWHVVNQTDQPVERVFYYLEGDRPRDFPDLNVRVTDEDGKELAIKSLNVNKPDKKEFFVQLNKPLKPHQKGRLVKLEYDWQEPDRHFYYKFSSDCKKYRFLLTAPKGMPLKQKVARVSPETGDVMYASNPPSVKFLKDRTEVDWTTSDIPAFDAYRFDW